jgi:hypothetical protein
MRSKFKSVRDISRQTAVHACQAGCVLQAFSLCFSIRFTSMENDTQSNKYAIEH